MLVALRRKWITAMVFIIMLDVVIDGRAGSGCKSALMLMRH